jgi:hypothetical protein
MKMFEMVKWLEDLGFIVDREYNKARVGYDFRISKGNREYNRCDFFPYPENVSEKERDKLQRRFLENFVDDFYRDFPQLNRNAKPIVDYTSFRGSKVCVDEPNTRRMNGCLEGIQKVIFNFPATIVYWTDGTKTVVKMQEDDVWDPEKGLAMAIVKKVYGNRGNYCNEIKRWLPREEVEYEDYDSLTKYIGFLLGLGRDEQKKILGE